MDQEVIRAMIMHENEIINDRLTWLLTFQGLLLASLGFAWGAKGSKPLVRIFAGLGIVVSVVSVFGLLTATNAMYGLVDCTVQRITLGLTLSAQEYPLDGHECSAI